MYRCAPLALLEVGTVLRSPIHDSQHRLLLGPGITITKEFLLELHRRGIRTVAMDEYDWTRLTAFSSKGRARNALPHRTGVQTDWNREATSDLDEIINRPASNAVLPSENPYFQNIQPRGATRYDEAMIQRVLVTHRESTNHLQSLMQQLADGQNIPAEAVHQISHDFLIQAAADMDLFVSMGINPVESNSIFAHSTNVATLAVALGATLGLDVESLRDLGTGCLVHDAGMMYLRNDIHLSRSVLSEYEFAEITRHPIIAADLLYKRMDRVPLGVRMIVYQMHERCNGSGYPRGWTAERIHPLAKIGAVADAYVALVSERPHRPAMLPYHAMAKMLQDVKAGLFDSTVVRALLHTISLFPIGSYVELDNGMVGKVIRANGPAYDQPIVEARWRHRRLDDPQIIDLSQEKLKVVKALTSLD